MTTPTEARATRSATAAAASTDPPTKPHGWSARILGRQPIGMVLAAPYAVFLAVVFAFPLGFALYMSVHDYFFTAPGVSVPHPFVGLANFRTALTDPDVLASFGHVGIFLIINVPLTVVLSLLLAAALNQAIRGRTFFRVAYYVPYVTASVAVVGVWLFLFNSDGLPNAILQPVVGQWTWWTNFFPLALGVLVVVQLIGNPDGIADVISNGPKAGPQRRKRAAPETDEVDETEADEVATPPAPPRRRVPVMWPGERRAQRAEQRRRSHVQALDRARALTHQPQGATLAVDDICVTFGTVVAVDKVSFEVRPGEVLSVIGPNGAGKTTLMDAITGFVPMRGSISLDGVSVTGASAHRRARAGIARSFQSLELLEDMSVMDNLRCAADQQDLLSLALDLVHPRRGELTAAVVAAVEHFGLVDKVHRLPSELNYGDRRLVAIARAVASGPAVLLLDEPAAGLSEQERSEVAGIITMLAKVWNIAVVLIEHDVALVRRVSDRVLALDFGRVIAVGDPDDVLAHPDVVAAYLGTEPAAAPPGVEDPDHAPVHARSITNGLRTGVAMAPRPPRGRT